MPILPNVLSLLSYLFQQLCYYTLFIQQGASWFPWDSSLDFSGLLAGGFGLRYFHTGTEPYSPGQWLSTGWSVWGADPTL